MSFKSDSMKNLVLKEYGNIQDLNEFVDPKTSEKLYHKMIDLINSYELNSGDKITLLKNITLTAIESSVNNFFEYKENLERSKMENEFK